MEGAAAPQAPRDGGRGSSGNAASCSVAAASAPADGGDDGDGRGGAKEEKVASKIATAPAIASPSSGPTAPDSFIDPTATTSEVRHEI